MSGKLFIHSSIDDAGLTLAEFRVLCHIARREGSDGSFASYPSIAKTCRVNKDTVAKALASLCRAGWITREQRTGQTTIFRTSERIRKEGIGDESTYPKRGDTTHPKRRDSRYPKTGDTHPSETEGYEGSTSEGSPQKGEEQGPLSLRQAVEMFTPEFPARPVRKSLSRRLELKGKESMTIEGCRRWLTNETDRIAPNPPVQQIDADQPQPITVEEQQSLAEELRRQREALGHRIHPHKESIAPYRRKKCAGQRFIFL